MNMQRAVIVATLAGLLASAPAMATKRGFYLGGSLGGASTEYSGDFDYDESDTAWKLFAGYHFLQFFAVEAEYRDLGSASDGPFKVDATAADISGLAGLPLGPVYLFGKLGVTWWDADLEGALTSSDDGTGYLVGIGGSIDLWKIQARAEVEYLDAVDGALMYTLGAAWRF